MMTELEKMLCRIGNEQEAADGQPFPFLCSDGESGLVKKLLARRLVHQTWQGQGPATIRFFDGYTQFRALSLTDRGTCLWKRLHQRHDNP